LLAAITRRICKHLRDVVLAAAEAPEFRPNQDYELVAIGSWSADRGERPGFGDEQVPGHAGVETCIAARAGIGVGGFVGACVRKQPQGEPVAGVGALLLSARCGSLALRGELLELPTEQRRIATILHAARDLLSWCGRSFDR